MLGSAPTSTVLLLSPSAAAAASALPAKLSASSARRRGSTLSSLLSVGLTAVYTLYTGDVMLLRPATVLALLSFLGTVGIARYVEAHEVVR